MFCHENLTGNVTYDKRLSFDLGFKFFPAFPTKSFDNLIWNDNPKFAVFLLLNPPGNLAL